MQIKAHSDISQYVIRKHKQHSQTRSHSHQTCPSVKTTDDTKTAVKEETFIKWELMWKVLWASFRKHIQAPKMFPAFFFIALLSSVPCPDLLKNIQPSTLVCSTLSTPDTSVQWGHVLKYYIFAFKIHLKLQRSSSPSFPTSPWSFNCWRPLHTLLKTWHSLGKDMQVFLAKSCLDFLCREGSEQIWFQAIVTALGFIITMNLNAFPEGCILSHTTQPSSARAHRVTSNLNHYEQCFAIHIPCKHGQDLKSSGSFFCLVICCLLTCGWICCCWTQRDISGTGLGCRRVRS